MSALGKIAKYEIRRELGKGAMGVVYEGYDPVIERTVAIKTIRPEQLEKSQAAEILARFKREAQAAGRLNHPHIVAIYDYGEVVPEGDLARDASGAQIAYIAMEFIKGRELKDYFDRNERFAVKDVERIMGELLGALDHAHRNGVVHRDMKPANVILLADGTVKVADFGIARIETSELTQAGTMLGTPAYMSPEQFLGQPVDGRSDIFSCGVILYQFLTGEKPFTGTVTTIMHKVLKEEPLPPSTLNVTLPPAWDAVVKKSMAKSPGERFQGAAEFAAAIRSAVQRQSEDQTVVDLDATLVRGGEATLVNTGAASTPVATSPQRPAAAAGGATPSAPGAASGAAARKSLTNLAILGGAAAALLLVVGGGYALFGKERAAPAPIASSDRPNTPVPANAKTQPSGNVASAPVPAATPTPVAARDAEPASEPGTMIISALGLVNPKDPRFKDDPAAAQAEARADAQRQLVEKALALYVDRRSLEKNYALIQSKLLSHPGSYIKTVLQESAPAAGKDGLIAAEARAAVKVREVQKSLNQMSREERIEFIRNNGDPRISILMAIRNADSAEALPPSRSQLAENVVKERIKSFGFRVWSAEGETKTGPRAQSADFEIQGEVRVKQLSARLAASGITVTKTALTSWTVKAIDKATGEEIYLNTVAPKGRSWATEDQALADIGKLVGEEFSKNFFLQHFNFGAQSVSLNVAGLPDAASARLVLRELRGLRAVLDAQLAADSGRYQLVLAEGSAATDIVQDRILKPLNAKLGQACFALAGASGGVINVSFAGACADAAVRAKLETTPPAGLLIAPEPRSRSILKAGAINA
ncbi:MAG TPA: serine/threonine-protein kinase [Burkholderiales bacterium]|nr:serine/threonine-protein kinase [Burkholderiales bacterium]